MYNFHGLPFEKSGTLRMNTPDTSPDAPSADFQEMNLHLREQNEQLKEQLMNTSLITELTRVLHSCGDLDGIIKTVLLAVQEIAGFDRAMLFEIDKRSFNLRPRQWVGIDRLPTDDFTVPLGFEGGEATDALFLNRHIIVEKPDAQNDVFSAAFGSESYVVIPLISRVTKRCWEAKSCTMTSCPAHGGYNPYCWSINGGGLCTKAVSEDDKRRACVNCACFKGNGVFWVDRTAHKRAITSDDITALTAIVNLAGIIIENFRILSDLDTANNSLQQAITQVKIVNHDLQIAQARIKADLDHARTIQLGLLPQDIEESTSFSVGARYSSADAVGGDYYDLFESTPGIFNLVVADVSGHGIASALIMSMVKMLLKTFAPGEASPQKTLERINNVFLADVKTDNFVTIFYALIDTTAHTLRYTSAGHCPVLLLDRRKRSVSQFKADGLFMGVFPDMMLKETVVPYETGNHRIVLFTDGLVEARGTTDELYGVGRLTDIAIATLDAPVKKALAAILDDQKKFCGPDQKVEDDITLLIVDL
jgi:serine phosphatase RsbU (regulator of sigma subunit)